MVLGVLIFKHFRVLNEKYIFFLIMTAKVYFKETIIVLILVIEYYHRLLCDHNVQNFIGRFGIMYWSVFCDCGQSVEVSQSVITLA